MAEKTKTTKTTKKAPKWDNIQKIGFWGLIIVQIAFWGGVYLGNTAAHNSFNEKEAIKASAVEAYKAELKAEQK